MQRVVLITQKSAVLNYFTAEAWSHFNWFRSHVFVEKSYYWLSKHLLLNDQRDAQFFSMYLFIFLTLYMFRTHRAHHQERQIVSIQPLAAVTLWRWPCRVQAGATPPNQPLPTCTRHGHRHRVTAARGCIDINCLSWWWARCARNM